MPIDSCVILETPEGAELRLHPAGFWVRSLAYSLDWLLRALVIAVVAMLLGRSGVGQGVTLMIYFVLEWLYPVVFEVWREGQTPGKKVMKIKVIHDDGTPITFAASLIRNLLRTVDFLPTFYTAGVITSLCNAQSKRLGDLAAATMVVHQYPPMTPPQLEALGSRPPPDTLNSDEQRYLLALAQRSGNLSPARQAELAQILTPLLGADLRSAEERVIAVKQIANHIVGRR